MITLSTIPARHHAALAGERVDVQRGAWSGPLTALDDEGIVIAGGRGLHAVTRARFDEVTLPATAHNARALAVVLAEACGLDVGGGVVADFVVVLPRPMLRLRGASRSWLSGPLRDINPTDPDALFRALVSALCALETA